MEADRASSSVMGVVLIVAVTVVLGATTAGYTGTLVNDAERKTAQASFSTSQTGEFGRSEAAASLAFVHETGDTIPTGELSIRVDGVPATETDLTVELPGDDIESGERITIEQPIAGVLDGGETVALVYTENGESTVLKRVTARPGGLSAYSPTFIFTGYYVGSQPGTPWTVNKNYDTATPVTGEVRDERASVGDRSLFLQSSSTVYSGEGRVSSVAASIDVNLTGVETISFQYVGGANDLSVSVNGTKLQRGDLGTTADWQTATIDVSDEEGVHTLTFHYAERTSRSTSSVYLDDVQFLNVSGERVSDDEVLP